MNKKIKLTITIIIWTTIVILAGLTYYANHYIPDGPQYPAGDYICLNDGRGPCGPKYKEDLSQTDIPDWAKFFKTNNALMLIIGLALIDIILRNLRIENQ